MTSLINTPRFLSGGKPVYLTATIESSVRVCVFSQAIEMATAVQPNRFTLL